MKNLIYFTNLVSICMNIWINTLFYWVLYMIVFSLCFLISDLDFLSYSLYNIFVCPCCAQNWSNKVLYLVKLGYKGVYITWTCYREAKAEFLKNEIDLVMLATKPIEDKFQFSQKIQIVRHWRFTKCDCNLSPFSGIFMKSTNF